MPLPLEMDQEPRPPPPLPPADLPEDSVPLYAPYPTEPAPGMDLSPPAKRPPPASPPIRPKRPPPLSQTERPAVSSSSGKANAKLLNSLPWRANPAIRFGGGGLIGIDRTINVITGAAIDPSINRMRFELEAFIPFYPQFPELNWLGIAADTELWLPVSIALRRDNNERVGSAKINERSQSLCAVFAPLFGQTVRQQIKLKGCPVALRRQTIDLDEGVQGQSQITFTSQNTVGSVGYTVLFFSPFMIATSATSALTNRSSVAEDSGGQTTEQEANWRRTDYQIGFKALFEGSVNRESTRKLTFDAEAFYRSRQEKAALDKRDQDENFFTSLYGFTLGVGFVP